MTSHPDIRRHGKTVSLPVVVCVAIALLPVFAAAQDFTSGSATWSIADTPTMSRWIVIHDPGSSEASGIYHIEVIGRKTGDPAWQIVRIVPHMAITEHALRASVVAPLESGAVYPESFDDAYAAWRAQNEGAGGGVCTSSVVECMANSGSNEK